MRQIPKPGRFAWGKEKRNYVLQEMAIYRKYAGDGRR